MRPEVSVSRADVELPISAMTIDSSVSCGATVMVTVMGSVTVKVFSLIAKIVGSGQYVVDRVWSALTADFLLDNLQDTN